MKTIIKIIFLLVLCNSTMQAQMKYLDDGYIRIGEEKYTPIIIENKWGIEYFEDGLNFWIPYPRPNWGNFKLFLKDDGNIGIGKKPSYKLDVAGDIATSGVYRTTSDIRLKSDIQDLSGCLDKIVQLKGKSYMKKKSYPISVNNSTLNYISDSIKFNTTYLSSSKEEINSPTKQFGFIAQELQPVFPELVSQNNEGYLSIDYMGLIPVIVEAIKEQKTALEKQEAEIEKIITTLNTLEKVNNINSETYHLNIHKTEIDYELGNKHKSAIINLYTIEGILINSYTLPVNIQKGSILQNSNLQSGIYYYTLICDGKNILSRKFNN